MLSVQRPRSLQGKCPESGFTLIEVLVTFVILAVGVLGIVSLLSVSKTSEYEAVQRTRAVNMADGLLERIRNNPAGVLSYVTGGANPPPGQDRIDGEPSPNCETADCTPAQMAAHDLWVWEQLLDGSAVTVTDDDGNTTPTAGLASPWGCVSFTPWGRFTRGGQLTVQVQWTGLQESTDGVASGEPVCGGESAGADPFRRQITVSTFVIDEAE